MPEPTPDLAAEFDMLMRRNGVTVPAATRDKMLPGYAELKKAVAMLRGRPHTSEPSNIYALPPFEAIPGEATK